MRNIFVLYDAGCELCRSCRGWIQTQKQLVYVTFLPAGSTQARQIFPNLDHEKTLRDLTVIDDRGGVYTGTKAWLMCLWVLRDFRGWSKTLASPELLPLAKQFFTMVSDNRKALATKIH